MIGRAVLVIAVLTGIAAYGAGLEAAFDSKLETALLATATAVQWSLTRSSVGPATSASTIWMTRTGGMTMADGPFDGVGMIVTSPLGETVHTVVWPLILTIGLVVFDHRRRRA